MSSKKINVLALVAIFESHQLQLLLTRFLFLLVVFSNLAALIVGVAGRPRGASMVVALVAFVTLVAVMSVGVVFTIFLVIMVFRLGWLVLVWLVLLWLALI